MPISARPRFLTIMLSAVLLHGILSGLLGALWALAGAGIYGSPLAIGGPIVILIIALLLLGPVAAFISGIMIFESPRLASSCLLLCGFLSGLISLGVAFVAGNIIPLLLVSMPMILLGFLLKVALHQQAARQFNELWTSVTPSLPVDQPNSTTDAPPATTQSPDATDVLASPQQPEQEQPPTVFTATTTSIPAVVGIATPTLPSTSQESDAESKIYYDNLNIALGAFLFFVALLASWFLDNVIISANPFGFDRPTRMIGVRSSKTAEIYTLLLITLPTLVIPLLRRWLPIRWEAILGIWIAQGIIILLWLIP